ncbi:hypothetical protein RND81_02G236100 [Saponaria officinalis]|uniref:Peptidase A1 domain-containing protein n=1 Tax=Saponaria officinalis TaxID=3572 RepID=A0AAW1MZ48_SAPOF
MYILLSYILVVVSYTFTDGFTLDLIHRYSPKSPFFNSSMTLRERSQLLVRRSASRYRHLKLIQNTTNTDVNTRLVQNNGDYIMKVSIGVPPDDVFVSVDTGSDLIWVQCTPCDRCYQQKSPIFDPTKSSTFKTVPCISPTCVSIPETECDYLTGECRYRYFYGDGSTTTSGIMATDVFEFKNSSILFGCGLTQLGDDFDENEAGIVGLSGGPLSLISQLGSKIENKFSYCLTPTTSNFTGKLRLGRRFQQAIINPLSWLRSRC